MPPASLGALPGRRTLALACHARLAARDAHQKIRHARFARPHPSQRFQQCLPHHASCNTSTIPFGTTAPCCQQSHRVQRARTHAHEVHVAPSCDRRSHIHRHDPCPDPHPIQCCNPSRLTRQATRSFMHEPAGDQWHDRAVPSFAEGICPQAERRHLTTITDHWGATRARPTSARTAVWRYQQRRFPICSCGVRCSGVPRA